ncbi:SDR family oxidoreductase [Dehalococcoidia bacterium]|nr:SDR family oxidoreductase [Dehalococcoidia bacterium]
MHPGFAITPMTEQSIKAHPDSLSTQITTVPMNRLGTAEEIASGILFLASEESSYITGAELVIDGGMTAA